LSSRNIDSADDKEKIKVLLVDDDEEDYLIVREIMSEIQHQQYALEWISDFEKAIEAIQRDDAYDVLLVDYNLGARTGLDLVNETLALARSLPIIIITGQMTRDIDLLAMKKGVSDFLVKGKFDADLLERSIRYAIERKRNENQILYLAYYDQLTDLPNRTFFREQLNYALAHAIRYSRILAVLFLDLDNFKLINDSLGHHVGDLLLKEVAKRLCACVRKSDIIARNCHETPIDTVARLGGDEFTISLTEIQSYEDASIVANRIIKSIGEPFSIENHEIYSGVSIGISLFPADSADADVLLKYADNAMYHAKKQGKNSYQYYQKSMNESVMGKMHMVTSIRKARDNNEFILYYQPKMDLRSAHILGFEALIRWQHADKGIVMPLHFIPFAEQHHLIPFITDWVIHEACRQLQAWGSSNLKVLPVSINLPVTQFKKPDFLDYLMDIVSSYNVSPQYLELELTESIFTEDMNSVNSTLHELRSKGFQISIDDFGTGFSSLNRLKEVPCNVLKVDRSFIQNIDEETADSAIVSSIIRMGHALQMQIFAEGVETLLQLKFLLAHDCDGFQGFILSPALPPEEAAQVLIKEEAGEGIGSALMNRLRIDAQ
jgi:diguanylate cyclase (GGDEF)-like protein